MAPSDITMGRKALGRLNVSTILILVLIPLNVRQRREAMMNSE